MKAIKEFCSQLFDRQEKIMEDNKLKSLCGEYNKVVCVNTEVKGTLEAL